MKHYKVTNSSIVGIQEPLGKNPYYPFIEY